MKGEINRKIGLGIGMYLITFLVCILVVSGLVWFVGWHITPFVPMMALLLALPVFLLAGTDRKESLTAFCISLGIIALSTLIASLVYDVSYDGNAYHQLVIYALGHGWNPVYLHHNPVIADSWNINICIDHYPKGGETMATAFYAVTGTIESGKAMNFFLPIALFLLLYDFFQERFIVRLSNSKLVLYSAGIAFSMISVGQMTSYYIDHIGYVTFILALLGVYAIIDEKGCRKMGNWCLLCSIAIAAAVKFNMLFWTGFIVLCALVVLLYRKRTRTAIRLAGASTLAAIVSIIVVSYNPLVTNTLDHHNPVYSIAGQGTTADETLANYIQPPYMMEAPRYKQIIYSYFQRPTNDVTSTGYIPPYKISKTNIYRAGFCSTSIGGGGLFFIEILIMTLIIFVSFRKGRYYKQFVVAALLLVSTLFILPMGSNFRYVPFIYLLPFLALLYLETIETKSKPSRIAQYVLGALLFCNITLCAGVTIATTALEQTVTMRSVKALEGKGGESFYTINWGFLNKLYHGDMEGKELVTPLFPEDRYEREKFIGGPYVYIIKP